MDQFIEYLAEKHGDGYPCAPLWHELLLYNLPPELTSLNQWMLVKDDPAEPHLDKAPRWVGDLRYQSKRTEDKWCSFTEAVDAIVTGKADGLGIVLQQSNGITIIDLDRKEKLNLTEDQTRLQETILAEANSYTERSRSGNGWHIVVKGTIPQTIQTGGAGLEVYSDNHFLICTGDAINTLPVSDAQPLLDEIVGSAKYRPKRGWDPEEDAVDPRSAEEILATLRSWKNGDAFEAVFSGSAEGKDKSREDARLIGFIHNCTKDPIKIREVFRLSPALATMDRQRNKIFRDRNDGNGYLNRTIGFVKNTVKDREEKECADLVEIMAQAKEVAKGSAKDTYTPLPFPTGLVGDFARQVYASSARPVADYAIHSALGCIAGIVGRQFVTATHCGLNLYLLNLGGTGTGKGSIAKGAKKIREAVITKFADTSPHPLMDTYSVVQDYASGPALHAALAEYPCHAAFLGEFGDALQIMSSPKAPAHEQGRKKELLNAYSESGIGGSLEIKFHASAVNHKKRVISPAVTIVAEGTATTFYQGLTPAMITSGLISRFIITHYKGIRVPNNDERPAPSEELLEKVNNLANRAKTLSGMDYSKMFVVVPWDSPEVEAMYKALGVECDSHVNSTTLDQAKELWNRVAENTIRLATLIAVGDNWDQPRVTAGNFTWAEMVIRRSAMGVLKEVTTGGMGVGDGAKRKATLEAIDVYLSSTKPLTSKSHDLMRANRIVYLSWLTTRLQNEASFTDNSNKELEGIMRNLEDLGLVQKIGTGGAKLPEGCLFRGVAYQVL